MANKIITPPTTADRGLPSKKVTMNLKKAIGVSVVALGLALSAAIAPRYIQASDHDDGEVDTKGRNLNLTDLFVFREQDQNPAANPENLVFIMNTNPRSVPRFQYYFSTRALYEFKVTRVTDNNARPTGVPDLTLRFQFGAPNANRQQPITLTAIRDGATIGPVSAGFTSPIDPNPSANPAVTNVSLGGTNVQVFAGLREDPFFFDVEQYFRVRAGARGEGPGVGFRPPETAIDFAKDYNVNAIAVQVPRAFLRGAATTVNTFDVWETISLAAGGTVNQFERVARPAINEGLIVQNDFLNALNQVTPQFEAEALAGIQPAANAAAPIIQDATRTLTAFGNSPERANALLGALLPDVMRIDTTLPSNYSAELASSVVSPGFNPATPGDCINNNLSPICGRKLTDDTIDFTLKVVTGNPAASDNVSYTGTPNNPSQGHDPLVGSFPYLAVPN